MEKRYEEFEKTAETAMSYLRGTAPIPSADSLRERRLVFRLWHSPSFSLHRSWSVFKLQRQPPSEDEWLVRQVTWDRPRDYSRLSDPLHGLREGFHSSPAIEVRDRSLDPATITSRISVGRSIAISVVAVPHSIGTDGETFGYEDGYIQLQWWTVFPAQWSEFAKWAGDMMGWLHETCAASYEGSEGKP